MYKRVIAVAFSSALMLGLLAGCAGDKTASSSSSGSDASTGASSVVSELSSVTSDVASREEAERLDFMNTATKDQYADLEVTASLRNKMAILPGEIFPVSITIKNNGDKTISYVQGAGTNLTPDALVLEVPDLQPIMPEDHLGISTMDFGTLKLEPGDSIEFVLNVAAIKPQSDFDEMTFKLYGTGEGDDSKYIGDFSAEELANADPSLVLAEAGGYTGKVYFPYTLVEDENTDVLSGPTGYTESEFSFTIS